jgi:small conductance mechanosensitive channel
LQDTLGNLAAGFFILLYRPYDVDDAIKAGGEVGLVKAMGMANTTIVTFDNRRLYVPNRKIWSDVIENRSTENRRRVATTLRISYDDDLDRALGIVRDFLAQHELVMDDPAPTVFVSELEQSWIEISVWPSALIENWWALTICLPQDLLNLLRREGIHMPYAQQEIRLRPMGFDKGEE